MLLVPGGLGESSPMTSTGSFSIAGAPYWVVFAAAFCIAFGRTQAIYWVGRGLSAGTLKTRWSRHLDGDRAQRAIAAINRFGPIAVTLSFLTIGLQTVVNLTAGYTKMQFWRYVAALVPGCLIWAAIWTTVGTVAFNAAVTLAATSPVGFAVIVVGLAGIGVWIWLASRRRRRNAPADHPLQDEQDAQLEEEKVISRL